jgi:hypothetical protein
MEFEWDAVVAGTVKNVEDREEANRQIRSELEGFGDVYVDFKQVKNLDKVEEE